MERSTPYRRPNWYQVLQLDPAADSDIISTVYRRLALRYHPDRDPSQEAQRLMRELNQA
jgi:DnaJ-class molecular chaperone